MGDRTYTDNIVRYQKMQGDKRVDVSNQDNWTYSSTIKFTRNQFLSQEWWDLHRYSWKDIETTLSAFSDPLLLWQALVAEHVDIPPPAIKVPWSQRQRLDYTDKAGALKKLNNIMQIKFGTRGPPEYPHKLTAPFPNNVPPIPTQTLTEKEWNEFLILFGTRIVNPEREYQAVFSWRGIDVLPFQYCPQNKLLRVFHVIPVEQYCIECGKPTDETNTPFTFWVGTERKEYYDREGSFWIQLPLTFKDAENIPEPY